MSDAADPPPSRPRNYKNQFKNAREILAALASIGQARATEDGRYVS